MKMKFSKRTSQRSLAGWVSYPEVPSFAVQDAAISNASHTEDVWMWATNQPKLARSSKLSTMTMLTGFQKESMHYTRRNVLELKRAYTTCKSVVKLKVVRFRVLLPWRLNWPKKCCAASRQGFLLQRKWDEMFAQRLFRAR